MAQINSIALGKLTGKLGNISTSYTKAKNIARSLPANSKRFQSEKLLISKRKYFNSWLFYPLLNHSLQGFYHFKIQKESISNVFLRIFNPLMPAFSAASSGVIYDYIAPFSLGFKNILYVNYLVHNVNSIEVFFTYKDFLFKDNVYFVMCLINKNSSTSMHLRIKMTKLMLNSNSFVISCQNFDYTNQMFYFYTSDKKFTSQIILS